MYHTELIYKRRDTRLSKMSKLLHMMKSIFAFIGRDCMLEKSQVIR